MISVEYFGANCYLRVDDKRVAKLRGLVARKEIVRAVNSHQALVGALGPLAMAAAAQVDEYNRRAKALPLFDPNHSAERAAADRWQRLYDSAVQALEQAKC